MLTTSGEEDGKEEEEEEEEGGVKEGRKEGRKEARSAYIKSNNPHLTGGESAIHCRAHGFANA